MTNLERVGVLVLLLHCGHHLGLVNSEQPLHSLLLRGGLALGRGHGRPGGHQSSAGEARGCRAHWCCDGHTGAKEGGIGTATATAAAAGGHGQVRVGAGERQRRRHGGRAHCGEQESGDARRSTHNPERRRIAEKCAGFLRGLKVGSEEERLPVTLSSRGTDSGTHSNFNPFSLSFFGPHTIPTHTRYVALHISGHSSKPI